MGSPRGIKKFGPGWPNDGSAPPLSAERLPATRNEQLQPVEFALGKILFVRTDRRLDLAERDTRLRCKELLLDIVEKRREFAAHFVYHGERLPMHGGRTEPQQRLAVLGRGVALVCRK